MNPCSRSQFIREGKTKVGGLQSIRTYDSASRLEEGQVGSELEGVRGVCSADPYP